MSVRLSSVGKKPAPTNVIDWPIPIWDSWIASKDGPAGGASAAPQPNAASDPTAAAVIFRANARFVVGTLLLPTVLELGAINFFAGRGGAEKFHFPDL